MHIAGRSALDAATSSRYDQARFEARARVIKAMAHPTRLFIVDELSRGERSVGELQEMIGADTSTVSKHLSVLRAAGIVAAEKRGNQVFHTLLVPCVLSFFSCVESVLRTSARRTFELAELPGSERA